jgi:hypothetical protein
MSAGSDNSNLGYGNLNPFVGNPNLVNPTNSHNPGGFGSNESPAFGKFGLPGAVWNVDAAKSFIPGVSFKGGARKLKDKIKNITKVYKRMKGGRKTFTKRVSSMKKRIMSRYHKKGGKSRGRGKTRRMRGGGLMPNYPAGYSQYQNNMPMTNTYSVGGVLSAKDLGLANPPPYKALSNCTNCTDNYNHNINKGFASRGWW